MQSPYPQDKIYDEDWVPYVLKDWNHYILTNEGINITGISHKHLTSSIGVQMNQTYPYNFYGDIYGLDLNFTVFWDGHDFTYLIDPNMTTVLHTVEYVGYGFTIHLNLGK